MGKNAEVVRDEEKLAIIDSQIAYKTKFLRVRHDTITFSKEKIQNWDFIEHPGSVAILALNDENQLILVEQWRYPVQKITLELPAGLIDPQESPEDAAKRELQEETGFKANFLKKIGGYYSSPGCLTEYVHIFLATDLEPSKLYADDTHTIDLKIILLSDAIKMIHSGTICDSKTVAAILQYFYV